MKRTIFLLTTVFAATAVLAWAGVKTKSDWDKTVDFSRYSTWNLSKGSVPPSTVIKAIVNEGVEEVMAVLREKPEALHVFLTGRNAPGPAGGQRIEGSVDDHLVA